MSKRKFCSHRGFNAVAPENTLPAFAAAVALGADEIEFDLWPTADGQLAVCHDPSVDRTTDGKGKICDMTWEQMKNLDAGKKFHSEYEGVRIPLFEEVLRQFAGKVVMNIHIKSIGASVLKNRIMEGRGPVSYTHLDVYKRQTFECAGSSHRGACKVDPAAQCETRGLIGAG